VAQSIVTQVVNHAPSSQVQTKMLPPRGAQSSTQPPFLHTQGPGPQLQLENGTGGG
jgi:hypothetical protein